MANVTYTGAGQVLDTDYKYVKWVGKTKGGLSIQIELPRAICRSNPSWTFAEKTEAVAEIEFEGVYNDTVLVNDDRTEPWKLTGPGAIDGKQVIQLGVGRFYVGASDKDAKAVGLTRGGGSFVVERAFHDINADDDPGSVEGRIWQDEGRPKLKLNALEWLDKIPALYSGMKTVEAAAAAQ